MINYQENTKRLIKKFVLFKRIGDEVRYLQTCCWEEEYQTVTIDWSSSEKFVPKRFTSEEEFQKFFKKSSVIISRHVQVRR